MSTSKFTPAETAKLTEFRKRVAKIYPECDERLITWLRARDLDSEKAEQMLRRHLIWKKNNEVDVVLGWKSPKVYVPYIYLGYDHELSPVYLFPFGHYELRAAIECGDVIPALRFIYQGIESILQKASAVNGFQGVVVLDMDGFRYHQVTNRTVVQGILELLRIVESNYPELLKHAIIINAPKIFHGLFAIVKPLLNARTLSKVQVYGSDRVKWLEDLEKIMPKDIIPPYWGGTRKGTDEFCTEDWFQEPLPRYFMRKLASTFDAYGEEWLTLKIAAGEFLLFDFSTKSNSDSKSGQQVDSVLNWAFFTDSYDIAFGVTYEVGDEQLVGHRRVDSHKTKQIGSAQLDKPGKYILKFDNTYSRSRSKILHYSISLTNVEIEANYVDRDSMKAANGSAAQVQSIKNGHGVQLSHLTDSETDGSHNGLDYNEEDEEKAFQDAIAELQTTPIPTDLTKSNFEKGNGVGIGNGTKM